MEKGIKLWGKEGLDVVLTKIQQVHDRDVVRLPRLEEITSDVKSEALIYLMFMKNKRNGEITGR